MLLDRLDERKALLQILRHLAELRFLIRREQLLRDVFLDLIELVPDRERRTLEGLEEDHAVERTNLAAADCCGRGLRERGFFAGEAHAELLERVRQLRDRF